jgi:hypothetical protein
LATTKVTKWSWGKIRRSLAIPPRYYKASGRVGVACTIFFVIEGRLPYTDTRHIIEPKFVPGDHDSIATDMLYGIMDHAFVIYNGHQAYFK